MRYTYMHIYVYYDITNHDLREFIRTRTLFCHVYVERKIKSFSPARGTLLYHKLFSPLKNSRVINCAERRAEGVCVCARARARACFF